MNRTKVNSTAIASVGYDAETKELEVEFTSGSLYLYSNVPHSAFVGLMSATSHGRYFDAHIRNGGYPYRQLR